MASLLHADLPSEDEEDDSYDPTTDKTAEPQDRVNRPKRKETGPAKCAPALRLSVPQPGASPCQRPFSRRCLITAAAALTLSATLSAASRGLQLVRRRPAPPPGDAEHAACRRGLAAATAPVGGAPAAPPVNTALDARRKAKANAAFEALKAKNSGGRTPLRAPVAAAAASTSAAPQTLKRKAVDPDLVRAVVEGRGACAVSGD